MKNPKHSIIIPAYNTGQEIRKCVESVLAQSYGDWELIIVDDGSNDNTPAIINEYAAMDSRIRVINIPNGGVSNARNVGLDAAHGEYVMFIDSDDRIEHDYLEQVENYMTDDSDIYIVGITQDFEYPDGTLSHSKVQVAPVYQKIIPESLADSFGYLSLTVNMASACLKTYRRTFIEEYRIRFNCQMILLEDYCFVLKCLIRRPQLSLLPYIGYHYQLPVILNPAVRRGNRDFYPSIHLVLEALDQMHQALDLQGHSYKVMLQHAQEILMYVFRQSLSSKFLKKSHYFALIKNDPFFIKYSNDMMINGGGRFRLQCKLMKRHLYFLAFLVYRYL